VYPLSPAVISNVILKEICGFPLESFSGKQPMKNTALLFAATASMLLDGGGFIRAAVLFDNGNHISDGRWSSASPSSRVNHAADNFLLPATTVITDVHWKGVYELHSATGPDDFSIRIYADNGSGMPTNPVTTSAIYSATVGGANRAPTGEIVISDYVVYSYSAFIPPFTAQGGTNYWLEIFNNATNDIWYWSDDRVISSGKATTSEFSSNWFARDEEHTFQLTNDVAEPASLIMWSGLIGLGLAIRRGARWENASRR
jgi:hypothetical protein